MTDEAIHSTIPADVKQEIRFEAARRETSIAEVVRETLQDRFEDSDE